MTDRDALNERLAERYPQHTRDESGDVLVTRQTREGTIDVNMTTLFTTPPRSTGDVSLLITEAELTAEGKPGDNPAVPVDARTEREAREELARRGLDPAWEVDRNS